jgi:hypothetical protein
MKIVGQIGEPPFGVVTSDGVRVLLAHTFESAREFVSGFRVVITAHTHKPRVELVNGMLFVNPGETSGWTYRKPTVAVLETDPLSAEIVHLPEMPPPAQ